MDPPAAGRRRIRELLEGLERHRAVGVRVVVHVDLVDIRLPLSPFEPVDVVLDRFVDVDRPFVDEHLGAEEVDLAEDPWPIGRGIDDDDVLGRGRSQGDLGRGKVLTRPVPAPITGLADVALLGKERQEVVDRRWTEHLAGVERQLEGGRPKVGKQHMEVVRIEPGLFGRAVEQELRMVDDVLVDRRSGRHKHRDACLLAPASTPELLPRRGDGPGIARQDRSVEAADVDAELERVRRDDAQDLAVAQAAFDGSPLRGKVTTAVTANTCPRTAALAE